MQSCDTAFRPLDLDRYPPSTNPTLQPFDTADLYLLQALADSAGVDERILVVNDTFGTLACALADRQPHSFGDSHLAERAMRNNLALNGIDAGAVHFIASQAALSGPYTRVLIRVPKSLALLEDQLARLRPHLAPGAVVVAGAMIKHLPHSAGDLLAKYIGSYQASLAWKKARLLTASLDATLTPTQALSGSYYPLPESDIELHNLPGVFSFDKLDNGTRAMLPCIPFGQGDTHIVDLGCGNGALGIMAALRNPEASLTFIDESYAAVASAQRNFETAFPGREAHFVVSDGLADAAQQSVDLVICNPPFHQQQVVGDEIALRMFEQASAALRPTGGLMIVGNRHLGYHVKLKRWFGKVEQLAATSKFVVLRGFN